jgi:hypothetical protein
VACACNDKFQVTSPNGSKVTYNTEFEAKAALRRGGGTIQRIKK